MCKTKMAVDAVQPTSSSSSPSRHRHNRNRNKKGSPSLSSSYSPPPSTTTTTATNTVTSHSSRHSLPSLRGSLPENAHLYDISEIRFATNNFLAKNYTASSSSSTRCWRCILHGKEVIIFQRKAHNIHILIPHIIRQKLSSICKSHHVAIVNLLGASVSGEYIYLVYDFINGANLYDLLHNKNNSEFTVLSSWMSRMQVATDLANGLNYIHNDAGLDDRFVHNHIKSSSVIVTEPSFNAKICQFGTAELCGEPIEERESGKFESNSNEIEVIHSIVEEEEQEQEEKKKETSYPQKLTRSNSVKFNGTTGYMSPEFQMTGVGTQKSDVYAFGVVLVELLSGEEPIKYKYNKTTKEYMKISALDAAKAVVEEGGGEKEGRVRRWVDKRLKDSYPVEVADKVARLAVDCLHVDPIKRPDMRRVAGKLSKLYLESQAWCDKMKIPTDFTVSFAPR